MESSVYNPACPSHEHPEERKRFLDNMADELKTKRFSSVHTKNPIEIFKELQENYGIKNLEYIAQDFLDDYVFNVPRNIEN